jgi:hypothetical protein
MAPVVVALLSLGLLARACKLKMTINETKSSFVLGGTNTL